MSIKITLMDDPELRREAKDLVEEHVNSYAAGAAKAIFNSVVREMQNNVGTNRENSSDS